MEKKFTSNIRKLRKEFNVSQPQLAKEIGYGKSVISSWEIGTQIPSAKAIIILSRYFQVSVDYILNVTNDNTMLHRIDDFDVDISIFNKRLKKLRISKNLSQDQLAKRTGLTQTSINHWENGKCQPNANAIVALARYFDVTTDYLLGESD
ncbi:MAG: helix-turn-helix domain-containing protein [Clostridia bacterium]|nr:helix-turn-helix domain-containing protein [Clostridia bacterium]MDE6605339.1 helix-turn-helix domain-containing protein [Clostridia bacterium]